MNAEKGGGEVKRGRVQMREYGGQRTDNRGGEMWGRFRVSCFSFMFHVSGVRLLSPPETGGVPAGGGGMI